MATTTPQAVLAMSSRPPGRYRPIRRTATRRAALPSSLSSPLAAAGGKPSSEKAKEALWSFPPKGGPLLIVPGFLSGAGKYQGMANELRSLGLFDAVEIVPLATADWYPTLAGGDFREILDKIESAAQCLLSSSSSSSSSSKKLLVVGHSAGGWLARCWMGSQPYSGGVVYSGASRVDTLLTLLCKISYLRGTPHYSLEAYPFGRVPEERTGENLGEEAEAAGEREKDEEKEKENKEESNAAARALADDAVWTLERARGSTLALTNLRYPGAHEPGVRYVAVCGRSVRGAELQGWRPGLPLAPVGAGVSYRASCGEAEVEGDGVTPVATAMLEGAEQVVLEGVLHQPGPGGESKEEEGAGGSAGSGGDRWYGSKSVVALWAPLLLGPGTRTS